MGGQRAVVPTLQRPETLAPAGADGASLTGESRGTVPGTPAGTGSVGGPTRVSRTPHAAASGAGRDAVPERSLAQRAGRRPARADSRGGRTDLGELALGRGVRLVHRVEGRATRSGALGCRRGPHAV